MFIWEDSVNGFQNNSTSLKDAGTRSQVGHDGRQRNHLLLLFGSKRPEIDPLLMTTLQTSLPVI